MPSFDAPLKYVLTQSELSGNTNLAQYVADGWNIFIRENGIVCCEEEGLARDYPRMHMVFGELDAAAALLEDSYREEKSVDVDPEALNSRIRKFITDNYSGINSAEIEQKKTQIKNGYNQLLANIPKNAMGNIQNGSKVEYVDESYNWRRGYLNDRENIYFVFCVSGIKVQKCDSSETVEIPGDIRAVFLIKDDSYELQQIESSNSILDGLLHGKNFRINEKIAAQAQCEETANELSQTILQYENDSTKPIQQALARQAKPILDAVKEQQAKANTKELNSLTEVLTETANVLCNPAKYQENYAQLTQKTLQGRRSIKKIVGGAMLCFLGVLGILVGVALTLSIKGAPFGIPLAIVSKKVFGVGAATIGLSALGSGSGVSYSGREKGLAKSCCLFQKSLQEANQTASTASAPAA